MTKILRFTSLATSLTLLGFAPSVLAATAPFSENFDGVAIGDNPVPNFTESSSTIYTVVAGTGGASDHDYQAVLSSASGGLSASAGAQFTNVVGNNFTLSTDFSIASFTAPSTSTENLGFGVLGTTANFSAGTEYRFLYAVAASTGAGTIGVLRNGTNQTAVQAGVATPTTTDNYTFTLTGTYVGTTLNFVATVTSALSGTTTTTYSDATPLTGQFFGYRTAINAVGGPADETIRYDNFGLAIPEPASASALIGGLGLLLSSARLRKRRTA